jgi:hypothetical protein
VKSHVYVVVMGALRSKNRMNCGNGVITCSGCEDEYKSGAFPLYISHTHAIALPSYKPQFCMVEAIEKQV